MPTRRCFVIAPIGPADSPIRERSDRLLNQVIRPAVQPFGYDVVRADDFPGPVMIPNEIIRHVCYDELLIADLTGRNPNVFYELALRHAIGKPFVQIIDTHEQIPFDVAPISVIQIDSQSTQSMAAGRARLMEDIRALESGSVRLETPVFNALGHYLSHQPAADITTFCDSGGALAYLAGRVLETKTSLDHMAIDVRRSRASRGHEEFMRARESVVREGRVRLRYLTSARRREEPELSVNRISRWLRDATPGKFFTAVLQHDAQCVPLVSAMIIDAQEVYVRPPYDLGEEEVYISIRHEGIVLLFRQWFEQLWQAADKIDPGCSYNDQLTRLESLFAHPRP